MTNKYCNIIFSLIKAPAAFHKLVLHPSKIACGQLCRYLLP
uniref:Uncharacterized protein n=1 Tax=Arundo donax TaxID=35708 RepID=A0A0A9HAN0_ARUDO